MSEKRIAVFSRSNAKEVIKNQIRIYHGLQRKAHRVLRLIVAALAVSAALIQAFSSGIIGENFEVRGTTYYYNETFSSTSAEGEIQGLIIVTLIGFILTTSSLIFTMIGLAEIMKVITSYGVYPYLPNQRDLKLQLASVENNVSMAKSNAAKLNSQILSNMEANLVAAYRYLTFAISGLIAGLIAVVAGYFAEVQIARLISYFIFGISMSMLSAKTISSLIEIKTNKAVNRLNTIDNTISKTTNIVLLTVVAAVVVIPAGIALFLFQGLVELVIIIMFIALISFTIFGVVIHDEMEARNANIQDVISYGDD